MTWRSMGMEPTICFGDKLRITPCAAVELEGIYLLQYPRYAGAAAGELANVIRRIRVLDDGQLHLSYDGAATAFGLEDSDEIVSRENLARWYRLAGTVEVDQPAAARGVH